MSNKNKKPSKNEEKKAQRLILEIGIALVILAVIMIAVAVYAA